MKYKEMKCVCLHNNTKGLECVITSTPEHKGVMVTKLFHCIIYELRAVGLTQAILLCIQIYGCFILETTRQTINIIKI